MPWLVRGDIDGFFGLALDNLVQLLVIVSLCKAVLGFPDDLLYGHVLPGAAVSLLAGNLFYAWQARRLAAREQRTDVCALPYGINTVSLFAYVFLVMVPAKAMATAAGVEDPARVAWQAGLLACFGSGLIELGGSLVAERIRRITPRAALLSTLAGIALGFISLGFLFRTYAHPVVGLSTLAIILLTYFGRVHFRGGLPGGLVAVALGTALGWMLGIAPTGDQPAAPSLALPVPVAGDLLQALQSQHVLTYLSVIIPMGLFNVIGSLQNIESAEAAGDTYPTAPSLAVNGAGTLLASLFGSCFPTTLYIGHPGWKAMGARAGYSILNGAILSALIFTGTLSWLVWGVPVDAGMAIVLWIGIVISAQAFQAVPRAHAPAVVLGLLPGIGAWGALMIKDGLRAAGVGAPGGPPFSADLVPVFHQAGVWVDGAFALEQGFILTAMLLAATTVFVIERHFARAAFCCLIAAALSSTGLMHGFSWTASDTVLSLTPAWPWAIAYAVMALCFTAAKWVTVADDAES
ncbi:MAG: NCS2 family permease [Pseudomonadota bacterium]|nr:NCS2 family permease [Pseudomonadota bacterium]